MGDVINLRLARKAQTRKAAESKASENRVRFGQTKAEKQQRKAEDIRAIKAHQSGLIEPDKP